VTDCPSRHLEPHPARIPLASVPAGDPLSQSASNPLKHVYQSSAPHMRSGRELLVVVNTDFGSCTDRVTRVVRRGPVGLPLDGSRSARGRFGRQGEVCSRLPVRR
jgi:hypothetical protein